MILMKYIKEFHCNINNITHMIISDCLFQTCIVLLPIVSIFITGLKYPVKEQIVQPVFQPPDWVFSVVWTYITLALGVITNMFYNKVKKLTISTSNWPGLLTNMVITETLVLERFIIMSFYFTILVLLNSWLVFNYNNSYEVSFYVLVSSCFISIMYVCYLCYISDGIDNRYLVFFLLPLPFWLCVASCLNGVIYQASSLKYIKNF